MNDRTMSWMFAALLLLLFLSYMTGYFWGKKQVIEDVAQNMQAGVLQDRMQASLFASSENLVKAPDVAADAFVEQEQPEDGIDEFLASSVLETQQEQIEKADEKRYYAPLIGFGTHKAAEKFALKLQKNNMPVKVKKRKSKTLKGKDIFWYQVVTIEFDERDELVAFVEKVRKQERLGHIDIVSC